MGEGRMENSLPVGGNGTDCGRNGPSLAAKSVEDDSSAPKSGGGSEPHSTTQDSEKQSSLALEPDPICSVLNVVIDFVMVEPTSLEQEEYRAEQEKASKRKQEQEQQEGGPSCDNNETPSNTVPCRVPVLRIFGPIVRRDAPLNSFNTQPAQSACLFVHGAFPYLLARPRVAGPDGSLHPFRSGEQRHIDWDDARAVERILPILKEALERSIMAASSFGNSDKNNQPDENDNTVQQKEEVLPVVCIRQITVVVGRGFYTYTPGPPAPFLRVEYYNPSERWKVKRSLEQGLDVEPLYHPDPRQFTTATGQGLVRPDDSALLRFHCYEAHIPYTMQFFKDYNLSGLSYIHVQNPRFRFLPKQRRQTFALYDEAKIDDHALFLESNASEYLWPAPPPPPPPCSGESTPPTTLPQPDDSDLFSSAVGNEPKQRQNSQSQERDLKVNVYQCWHPPPLRETVCDVEIDVHACDILNVLEIMTEQQGTNVHWRAVPSLRELWAEERQRMSLLLPATEENEAFTLAVKNPKSAQPGTKLAVEGMQRLLESSENFVASGFNQAAQQIVQRYKVAIDNVEEAWLQPPEKLIGSPANTVLTPDFSDALSDLGNLDKGTSKQSKQNELDTRQDAISSTEQTRDTQDVSFSQNDPAQHVRFVNATQSYYNGTKMTTVASEKELTQRIDRGESVIDGPFRHVEDFIDPATLRPFEILEEEESPDTDDNIGETDEVSRYERIEAEMQIMATQTCDDEQSTESFLKQLDSAGVEDSAGQASGLANGEEDALIELFDSSDDDTLQQPQQNPGKSQAQPPEIMKSSTRKKPKKPPRRKFVKICDLLSMPVRNQVPSWLENTHQYFHEQELLSLRSWFPPIGVGGIDVRLARPAPTRREVVEWCRKDRHKRENPKSADVPLIKQRKSKGAKLVKQTVLDVNPLAMDGNTRKLVSTDREAIQKEGIEEVEWQTSHPGTQEKDFSQQLPLGTRKSKYKKQLPTAKIQTDDEPKNKAETLHNEKNLPDDEYKQEKKYSSGKLPEPPPALNETSRLPDTLTDCGASPQALQGIGNQGGRLWVEGGGTLKARTRHYQAKTSSNLQRGSIQQTNGPQILATPVTIMSLEIHVQCRTGRAGVSDLKQIAMVPNADRDKISAAVYVFAKDPGGGEKLQILERGCIFVPVERETCEMRDASSYDLKHLADTVEAAIPKYCMGIHSPLSVECVEDERKLLLRLSAKVLSKDADMLISWDPQSSGLGYIVERGVVASEQNEGQENTANYKDIDMASLLGRLRLKGKRENGSDNPKENKKERWRGSGLGKDWDERVGPGVAAASIEGRLVFATWKLIAEEVKHPNASYLQAIVSSVLNRRIPFHDNLRLTQWYGQDRGRERYRTLHHKLNEATASLLLLDALDIVGRAGEGARLSGVEFSQSFPGIRGSQYKVEGVLLRALRSLNSFERGSKKGLKVRSTSTSTKSLSSAETKSPSQSPWKLMRLAQQSKIDEGKSIHDLSDRAYFFFSPSLDDTNRQEALEVQALTLEPESGHIEDPVVVCDFTALYPSLIIAYNLCFSTCAGQLTYHSTRREMAMEGRCTGKVGPMRYPEDRTATVLKQHMKSAQGESTQKNRMYVTPSRSAFVSESVVKGVLPLVLDEMLSTRAMLKKAAKRYKKSVPNLAPAVLRQLEARQLALKYISNVVYGYTSATFSGRCSMPLLADTIVECARRTLKNAIDLANKWGMDKTGRWHGCRCVYGDTDSVFVRLPGRTVKEAFQFGEEFCRAVTRMNPPPVQLKLEKVYLGTILQTKKKYCGMKFESKDDKKPVFEAKGIETVRRDQCSLTQKVLRNCLVTLFAKGIEAVKMYLFRQWSLILSHSLPVSDFILTGRVRSMYRGDGVGPVQAVLARRLAEADPGRVVRHKERVPYVIVATPGVKFKLRDGVLTPMELLEQWDAYVLNTAYYITKHVNPALDRCLSLPPHKIDVFSWFSDCPKPRRHVHFWPATIAGGNAMLPRFFGSSICALCGSIGEVQGSLRVSLCQFCRDDYLQSLLSSLERLNTIQADIQSVAMKCGRCGSTYEDASTFAVISSVRGSAQLSSGVATPLANCSCIDCPVTFERHRLRESEIEVLEVCSALKIDVD